MRLEEAEDYSPSSQIFIGSQVLKIIPNVPSGIIKVVEALEGDGYLWLCPKGTSKKYKSELNRYKVLEVFAPYDFEGVSLIAIDDDWSALIVKNVDNIKTMKRKTAISEKGKERITKGQ